MTDILFPKVNAPENVVKEPKLEQDLNKAAYAGFSVGNNDLVVSLSKGNEDNNPRDSDGFRLDEKGERLDVHEVMYRSLFVDKGNDSGYNGFENPKIKALPEEDKIRWASSIASTRSEDDVNWVLKNIEIKKEVNKFAAQTFRDTDFTTNLGYGLGLLAGMALDPTNYIVIGHASKAGKALAAARTYENLGAKKLAAKTLEDSKPSLIAETAKGSTVVAGSVFTSVSLGQDVSGITDEEKIIYTTLGAAAGGALSFGLSVGYNKAAAKEIERIYSDLGTDSKIINTPAVEQAAVLKEYVPPKYADIQENVDFREARITALDKLSNFKVTPEVQKAIKDVEAKLAKGDEFYVNGEKSINAKEIVVKGIKDEEAIKIRRLETEGGYISLADIKQKFTGKQVTADDPIEEMGMFVPKGKIQPKAANSLLGQVIFDATYHGIVEVTSPAARMMNSGFDTIAQWTKNMYGTPVLFDGLDPKKITTPQIHDLQVMQHNNTIKFEKSLEKHYSNFVAKNGKKLEIDGFLEEFHKLVHTGENSIYPQVKEFADDFKKNISEPWLKELEEVGLIEPGTIKLGDGEYYFHRAYDIDKINLNKEAALKDFKNMFSKGRLARLEKELLDIEGRLGKQSVEYKFVKDYLDSGQAMIDAHITATDFLDDVAFDRISFATFKDDGKFSNRTTKYRLEDINPKMIYKWLNNKDVQFQFARMNREHVFDYVATKNGWRRISDKLQKEFDKNLELIDKRIEKLKSMSTLENKTKIDANIAKLEKTKEDHLQHYKDVKADFQGVWNRLRGRDAYGNVKGGVWHQVVRGAQTLTAATAGHNMGISTLPEIVTLGAKWLKTKWGKRHIKFIQELGRPIKDANLSKETLEAFAIRVDALGDFGRQNTINGGSDLLGLEGKAGRVISKANDIIYIANFMRALTNWSKTVSAELAANELIEKALIGVSKADDNYLQRLGLKKSDLDKFKQQIIESGSENPAGWKDKKITDRFMSAVREKVHGEMVIEAHSGGKPLVSDSLIGRIMTQFKTFMLRAAEAYVARSAQEFTLEQALNMMTRMTGGMLAYYLRSLTRNDSSDIDTSINRLAYEGIMNSGIASGYDMGLRTLSLAARKYDTPALDPTKWFGVQDERIQSRMNQDIITGTVLGASGVLFMHAERFGKATSKLAQGEGQLSDYQFLLSYAPVIGSPIVQKQVSLLTND